MERVLSGLVWLLMLLTVHIQAQYVNISGQIFDSRGEPLVQASAVDSLRSQASLSNTYGFYSLGVRAGQPLILKFSYVGHTPQVLRFSAQRDTVLNIILEPQTLEEVKIVASKTALMDVQQISSISLNGQSIKMLPALMGEADVIKAFALTPGVNNGNEGSAGLYVRGGSTDQNLILLDGAPVYNPNHLFGFLSVFNPDIIKKAELIKGGIPARYGGRLSSVLDIVTKEGSTNQLNGEASIGLVSSKFSINGPIVKDKIGFLLSARTSYLDLILLPTRWDYNSGKSSQFFGYGMSDLNGKLSWKISPKDQLYWSFYTGSDQFRINNQSYPDLQQGTRLNWGNLTSSLRYNRILNAKMFWNTTLYTTKFNYTNRFHSREEAQDSLIGRNLFSYSSGLNELALRSQLDFLATPQHYLRLGLDLNRQRFSPRSVSKETVSLDSFFLEETEEKIRAHNLSLFAEDEFKLSSRLTLNGGLRLAMYRQQRSFWRLEPRLNFSYRLFKNLQLRAGYNRMNQFIHLISQPGLRFQNDLWIPSTTDVSPQSSSQIVGGLLFKNQQNWTVSLELYHKKTQGIIDFSEGSSFLQDYAKTYKELFSTDGSSISKGVELFLQKKSAKLDLSLAYTLSKTTNLFADLNNGQSYAFVFDARHNLALGAIFTGSKGWSFALNAFLRSGFPVTLPTAAIPYPAEAGFDGTRYVFIYTAKNNARLPVYHRGDLAVHHTKQKPNNKSRTWTISIFNFYNRQNPYHAQYENIDHVKVVNGQVEVTTNQQYVVRSFLPIIPSFAYSFTF